MVTETRKQFILKSESLESMTFKQINERIEYLEDLIRRHKEVLEWNMFDSESIEYWISEHEQKVEVIREYLKIENKELVELNLHVDQLFLCLGQAFEIDIDEVYGKDDFDYLNRKFANILMNVSADSFFVLMAYHDRFTSLKSNNCFKLLNDNDKEVFLKLDIRINVLLNDIYIKQNVEFMKFKKGA